MLQGFKQYQCPLGLAYDDAGTHRSQMISNSEMQKKNRDQVFFRRTSKYTAVRMTRPLRMYW